MSEAGQPQPQCQQPSGAATWLYPMRLRPIYRDYIWGGSRIAKCYNRDDAPARCAESWEVTDRPDASSEVINGPLVGKTLRSLLSGADASGFYGNAGRYESFPVICKILDARERLSVQVHPFAEAAARLNAEPKTEMWFILDAEPGSKVYIGLQPGVDEKALRAALKHGTVEHLLVPHAAAKGDAFYIPSGVTHAIGEGCLIYEVQQNSDTTFRLFDWNRLGPDKQPRELHIDQALESIDWAYSGQPRLSAPVMTSANLKLGSAIFKALDTPFFKIERILVAGLCTCATMDESPHLLFVEQGRVFLDCARDSLALPAGSSVLIPAALREYGLSADAGRAIVLRTLLPRPANNMSPEPV